MQQNKLNVVLCWHMHQPQYRCNDIYTRPWTWLHAIKDYTEMAAHIEAVPDARAVVNFSPHLMVQIDDYTHLIRRLLDSGESGNGRPHSGCPGWLVAEGACRAGRRWSGPA